MKVFCVACPHTSVIEDAVMVRSRVNENVWVCLMCGKTVKVEVEL